MSSCTLRLALEAWLKIVRPLGFVDSFGVRGTGNAKHAKHRLSPCQDLARGNLGTSSTQRILIVVIIDEWLPRR